MRKNCNGSVPDARATAPGLTVARSHRADRDAALSSRRLSCSPVWPVTHSDSQGRACRLARIDRLQLGPLLCYPSSSHARGLGRWRCRPASLLIGSSNTRRSQKLGLHLGLARACNSPLYWCLRFMVAKVALQKPLQYLQDSTLRCCTAGRGQRTDCGRLFGPIFWQVKT